MADSLAIQKTLYRSLFYTGLFYGFVLYFIADDVVDEIDTLLGGLLVALGIAGIAGAMWSQRRPFDPRSADSIAASYRTNFMIGYAFAEAPLIVGFVLGLIRHEMWPYLAVVPFYVIAMLILRPSQTNLERQDEKLRATGSALSLEQSLKSSGQDGTPNSA
jgi:hypothetical protein